MKSVEVFYNLFLLWRAYYNTNLSHTTLFFLFLVIRNGMAIHFQHLSQQKYRISTMLPVMRFRLSVP